MFWYEDEVKQLETLRANAAYEPETLFYGSSSIRLWAGLVNEFSDFKPVNLGFGGSTLAACTWFFERIMAGYQPKRLVIYAGDNDLGDGRHPEEVFIFFQQFAVRVAKRFGPIPCYYISLKPSEHRWHLINQFSFTNGLIAAEIAANLPNWHFVNIYDSMLDAQGKPIAAYYLSDGLHLSEKGYQVWNSIVLEALGSHN